MTNNSIEKNDLKLRWWQSERVGFKKFFQWPKLKWWQIGILVGILFPGLIGIFYFKDIPTLWGCKGFEEQLWPLCFLFALGLFFGLSIIGGIICVYIIKGIAEVIQSKKKRNKNTKITILIVVALTVLVGGGILAWQYWGTLKEEALKEVPADKTTDWTIYRNEEYGFSFEYPQQWGDVSIIKGKNPANLLKGEYFEIIFTNQAQIDPDGYNNIPRIVSFSTDWEVFEEFGFHWREDQSAEDFCKEYIGTAIINDGCKKINISSDIFVVNGANYTELGMFGPGDRILFIRNAFVELEDEQFKGLVLSLFFSSLIDPTYPQKTASEIKNIAISNFNQAISFQENKIEVFDKILSSFSVNETSNWKTYQSSKMGFAINYPADWETGPEKQVAGGTTSFVRTDPYEDMLVTFRSGVFYEQITEGKILSFQEVISKTRSEVSSDPMMKEEIINIANKEAIKFTYNPKRAKMITEPDLIRYEIYIPQDEGKIFTIAAIIRPSKQEIYIPIFNQILSTFKFIKTQDETADWKTYRNDIYNYELKYPASWYFYDKGNVVYNPSLESCVNGEYRDPKKTVLFSKDRIAACLPALTHRWDWFSIWVRDWQWSAEELNRTGIVKSEGTYDSECQRELDTTKYEQITFKGLAANKGVALAINAIGDEPGTQILFNYKDRGWQITYPNDCDGNPLDPAFEQILSTFKFLALL